MSNEALAPGDRVRLYLYPAMQGTVTSVDDSKAAIDWDNQEYARDAIHIQPVMPCTNLERLTDVLVTGDRVRHRHSPSHLGKLWRMNSAGYQPTIVVVIWDEPAPEQFSGLYADLERVP